MKEAMRVYEGDIPTSAIYGVYDHENGEWTGRFFATEEEAREVLRDLDLNDQRLGVVSTTDPGDRLSSVAKDQPTDFIDSGMAIQIHGWNKRLIALREIVAFVSEEMSKLITPLINQNSLEMDEELLEILQGPSFWRYELIRRIKALKELRDQ